MHALNRTYVGELHLGDCPSEAKRQYRALPERAGPYIGFVPINLLYP